MRDPLRVIHKLDQFAERRGSDGVARAMRLMHCTGIPGDANACVVHDYMSRKVPDIDNLEVDGTSIEWGCGYDDEKYRAGDALQKFMDRFDVHEFPELECVK